MTFWQGGRGLIDGKRIYSYKERGEPLTIPVSGVIHGWDEALQLMPVGSKWKLYIPSNLGYGDRGLVHLSGWTGIIIWVGRYCSSLVIFFFMESQKQICVTRWENKINRIFLIRHIMTLKTTMLNDIKMLPAISGARRFGDLDARDWITLYRRADGLFINWFIILRTAAIWMHVIRLSRLWKVALL